jgi:hypothetical protein
MQISIGLPATIPGVSRELLFDWARKAEAGPFASLGIIGRLVYPNDEVHTIGACRELQGGIQ